MLARSGRRWAGPLAFACRKVLQLCNDYGNNIPYTAYLEAFSQTGIPVRFPRAAPNLEPRDDIWPTDTAPVIRQADVSRPEAELLCPLPAGSLRVEQAVDVMPPRHSLPHPVPGPPYRAHAGAPRIRGNEPMLGVSGLESSLL